MNEPVVGRAEQAMSGEAAVACVIDQTLRVLDAKPD
jgi:hypothetical protein